MQATPKSSGEEPVAHLEHVGVAAEQRGADDADREAEEDHGPDEVDRRRRTNCMRIQATENAAGDDERRGVAADVAAHEEVDADRQRGAEDEAGQVLADRRDPGCQAGPGGGLPRRRPRCLRFHACKGTAGNSGFRRVGSGRDLRGPRGRVPPRSPGSWSRLGLAAAFFVARSYVRRHWRLVPGPRATRGVLATLALAGGRPGALRRRGPRPTELSRGHGGPGAPAHVGGGRGCRGRGRPRRVARRPGGRAAVGVPLAPRGGRRARRAAAAGTPAAAAARPGRRRAPPGGRGHRCGPGRPGGRRAGRERRHRAAGALPGAPRPRRGRHRVGRAGRMRSRRGPTEPRRAR